MGAIKLREHRSKAQHLQLCIFVHSVCRLVIKELMQQYQEKNLPKMTRTCEIILQKRQLSYTDISRDLRINGGLIVDLMIWKFLFFSVFVFWFMFSAFMKVFRYFWDRNILWAKSSPISDRTDDLLRTIFENFCVFPVNHLLENWFTAKRRDFCHQNSPCTNFYVLDLIGHQPSNAWVILEI